jgi:FlgN protein
MVMTFKSGDPSGLADVSDTLWNQRRLLELLQFKLEAQQSVLLGNRSRWLAQATGEIAEVVGQLRTGELVRAMAVQVAATQLGVEEPPTLLALAAQAPGVWAHILSSHRVALVSSLRAIQALANGNHDLLARGRRQVRDALQQTAGDQCPSPTLVLDPVTHSDQRRRDGRPPVGTPRGLHQGPPASATAGLAGWDRTLSVLTLVDSPAATPQVTFGINTATATGIPGLERHGQGYDDDRGGDEAGGLILVARDYEVALSVAARVIQPSLEDFLA